MLPQSKKLLGGVCMFCPCLQGFYLGTLASFHAGSVVRLIDESKLAVSVTGYLSLCVNPMAAWQPVQGVLCLLPCDSWNYLQPHDAIPMDKQKKMDGDG